jgi:hypothetical protein
MNEAEAALRKATFGPALHAVRILNRWTAEDRCAFRRAYQAEDWVMVYRLCMNKAETNTTPPRQVLMHLLDATDESLNGNRPDGPPANSR